MQDIQKIFDNLNKKKEEKKELQKMFKEALTGNMEYVNANEELKAVREKQKGIKANIMNDYHKEAEKIDDLNADIASEKILLTDIAISSYVNGKTIDLQDEKGNKYEPEFSVAFKKI
jgi:hypothetical protein